MMDIKERTDRIKLIRELDKKQEIVNQLYEEQGLTDEILDLQIEINTIRNRENITDQTETIYKNFVQ